MPHIRKLTSDSFDKSMKEISVQLYNKSRNVASLLDTGVEDDDDYDGALLSSDKWMPENGYTPLMLNELRKRYSISVYAFDLNKNCF